jgi:hypothetical protein
MFGFRTPVPEAAIGKNRQPRLAENKIWFAENRLMPPPSGDAVGPKKLRERKFRGIVPSRANEGHDFGAFYLGENISHLTSKEFAKKTYGRMFWRSN